MTTDAPRLPDRTVTLTEGARIPLLGFGTWQIKGQDAVRATSSALESGYRHLAPPARQHGVRWRIVERVLHLDHGEATRIRRLGDRPPTQPDANVHSATGPGRGD